MIAAFTGQNGKIFVFEDHIAISRKTFGGFLSQGGFSGDRQFFYKDIMSFEYKKPTIISNGYFKVILHGAHDTNAKFGLSRSSFESMKDPNTVILRAFTSRIGEESDRMYELIMDKLGQSKNSLHR